VNGPGPVWVERGGELVRTDIRLTRQAIDLLVERVTAPLGLRADRATPVVDARLADGSRVHVVLPPLAVDGPAVTIRRFGATAVRLGAFCSPDVERLLGRAMAVGYNLVVAGGTGAGKTTLLNALCGLLPASERVVTVEDAAELRLPGDHVVRLETRPATADGLAAVGVRELVRAALRMRPDRIVVGEVRGAEALDMVQAMNTGHGGCLSTCHANGPVDALRRIETMALLGDGRGVPLGAVRSQMAGAIDLVVHVVRTGGARRRVAGVAEVVEPGRLAADGVEVRPLVDGDRVVARCSRPPRRPGPIGEVRS
jgi:pilus assembly protein CpaF